MISSKMAAFRTFVAGMTLLYERRILKFCALMYNASWGIFVSCLYSGLTEFFHKHWLVNDNERTLESGA